MQISEAKLYLKVQASVWYGIAKIVKNREAMEILCLRPQGPKLKDKIERHID